MKPVITLSFNLVPPPGMNAIEFIHSHVEFLFDMLDKHLGPGPYYASVQEHNAFLNLIRTLYGLDPSRNDCPFFVGRIRNMLMFQLSLVPETHMIITSQPTIKRVSDYAESPLCKEFHSYWYQLTSDTIPYVSNYICA